jgi:glycyl-tRNA synthetase beta chain
MLDNTNLLFELGTEEIPAGYIPTALEALKEKLQTAFNDLLIDYSEIETYATPRRIVVCVSDLAETQKEETVEMRGPSVDKAFDDNDKPSKALLGFLRGNGVELDAIEKRDTGKGVYVFVQKTRETKPTVDLLPELLTEIVHTLPFPKKMKWSTKEIQFPRPLRYLFALYNDKTLSFEIDGIKSSNVTRGHFIQNDKLIEINSAKEYEQKLIAHGVTLDQTKRSHIIKEKLTEAAKSLNLILVEDDELVETVTYLVEDINPVICTFEERFLKIPDIVLIAEMREHQKYFALRNQDGTLSNKFCVISNNPETDFVREGNERVIRARFSDAEFFFDEDAKKTLYERIDDLKAVLFHKELGSVFDKVERMKKIATILSQSLSLSSELKDMVERAVMLSKTDLTTAMVFEFTSLQGQVGRIYAQRDGENKSVSDAIDNHYKPRFHGDDVPTDTVSVILSLSEKIDNIFGSYSVGNIPKGSQDPYALRRQGYAIVDLLVINGLNVELKTVFDSIKDNYNNGSTISNQIIEFITARAKTRFGEDEILYDEFDAVTSTGSSDFYELHNRAKSLHEFRTDGNFSEMLASFKRMNNIITSFLKKNSTYTFSLKEDVLVEEQEKALFEYFSSKADEIENFTARHEYVPLFEILTGAKEKIDSFFDNIMVMADDTKLRDARLGLLNWILQMFSAFIDFSKLSDK